MVFLSGAPARAIVGDSAPDAALEAQSVMVLKRSHKGSGFCTGLVLSSRVVLTSAHCVARPIDTRLHWQNAQGEAVLIDVERVVTHPQFRAQAPKTRERSIDLALVRSTKPLPFTPARLSSRDALGLGERVRIGGFGLTREGVGPSGGRFRAADLVVRAPLSHVLGWAQSGDGATLGACTGDSGGGMFDATGEVIGVVAWSSGAGKRRCGAVTQSILVAPERGWIERVRAELE
jgi:S1-C subfamily serine protease